ncbi:unnamed protein product [Symbiodinium sp. CCMP2592]|nr:unnamed protein product [Symbiodinium sp. CCMP2592]
MQPRTTTCWVPSETSLKRESFNDIVLHKTTNISLRLMSANVMGRSAMSDFPAVGDRSYLTAAGQGKFFHSSGSFRKRSTSAASLKSLRFNGSSQDGNGSIRMGTPVAELSDQRRESLSGNSRHGYMPPEAGRIEPKDCNLSPWILRKVEALYQKMDENADGRLTKAEAQNFFSRFGKISASAMFSEVDENNDGEILPSEWRYFWQQVRDNGYSEGDIAEELQELMSGGVWVDFLDDRNVSVGSRSAPKVGRSKE